MKMNVEHRDKGLLTLVLGMLIFFLSCYFGFRNFYNETQQLRVQNEMLNEQLAELEKAAVDKEKYAGLEKELQSGMEEKIRQFPEDIISEEIVLYMEELEQKSEVHISEITIPEKRSITMEQEGNPAEVSEDSDATAENNHEADGENISDMESMSFSCVESDIAYSATYSGLKDMLRLITVDTDRKSIDNISGIFDEKTGKVSGTMTVNFFLLEESGKE